MPVQPHSVQSVGQTDSVFLVPLWPLSMSRFCPFGFSCSAPVTLISGQMSKIRLDTTYRKLFNSLAAFWIYTCLQHSLWLKWKNCKIWI